MGGESLAANYARAGYTRRLVPGKRPALLLIDLVGAYFLPDSPLYGGEGCAAALAGASQTTDAWRTACCKDPR